MNVRKAVILAAGYGTRFLPATKAIPKEMLPLVDRPAIQHVVEEAIRAGLEQIIMVTAAAKRAVEDHFDRDRELERWLEQKGNARRRTRCAGWPAWRISFAYVRRSAWASATLC